MKKLIAVVALLLALVSPASAVVNFPASLDSNSTLFNLVNGDVYIAQMHNQPKDAILALEAKVGIDGSSVVTSLDYLVKNTASVNPGHTHTGTSVSFADGTESAPGLRFGSPVTDTDTGLFHPGTGVIAVSAAGSEIVRVTATGLGILTTSVNFPLDVAGTVRLQGANQLCFGGTGGADNDTCVARSAAHVLSLAGSFTATDVATGDNTLVLKGIAAKTGKFVQIFLNTTDANPIMQWGPTGTLEFGAGGASAVDTNLRRSGVDTLQTDDSFVIAGTSLTIASDGGGANSLVAGTVNGLKIGTATAQKLGFYNATPVVQPTASAGLLASLQALGLIASGTFSGDITTTGTVNTGGLVGGMQAFAAANGANNNVTLNAGTTALRVTAAGAFSISGITGGTDGRILMLYSASNQTFTLTNDATSTAANRFLTQTGADMVCTASEPGSFTLVYDGTSSRWRVMGVSNCPATPWT